MDEVELITLEQAKEHLNMDLAVHDEDFELMTFIWAASAVVEQHTGQVIARRTVVEDHYLTGKPVVVLRAAPVVSLTSVISVDGLSVSDHASMGVDGPNGIVYVPALQGLTRFTFVAGPAEVSPSQVMATQIICGHLWTTQRVSALAGPGFGGMEQSPAVSGRGYLIPNQAAQLLGGRAPNSP